MKAVMLVGLAVFLSLGAAAQPAVGLAKNRGVAKTGQKTGKQKAAEKIAAGPKSDEVITLTDSREHKAKSRFEQVLMRRLEVDAETGEKEKGQKGNNR